MPRVTEHSKASAEAFKAGDFAKATAVLHQARQEVEAVDPTLTVVQLPDGRLGVAPAAHLAPDAIPAVHEALTKKLDAEASEATT